MADYRFWTNHEIRKLRHMYGSVPIEVIARRLNREVGAIYRKALNLGLNNKDYLENLEFGNGNN